MTTTFKESQQRSIAKTLTIRVLFSLSHLVNGFIVSGSWIIGAQILGIAAVVNMFLHWAHERAWNWVQWNRRAGDSTMFLDGQPRTISKSVTWRALITVNNFLIPYITTGSWKAAAAFLTIATVMNIVIYYTHERVWNRFAWGKIATA
jgi:uncharacterized membrane protein